MKKPYNPPKTKFVDFNLLPSIREIKISRNRTLQPKYIQNIELPNPESLLLPPSDDYGLLLPSDYDFSQDLNPPDDFDNDSNDIPLSPLIPSDDSDNDFEFEFPIRRRPPPSQFYLPPQKIPPPLIKRSYPIPQISQKQIPRRQIPLDNDEDKWKFPDDDSYFDTLYPLP